MAGVCETTSAKRLCCRAICENLFATRRGLLTAPSKRLAKELYMQKLQKQTLSDTHHEIAPLSDQDFAILDTLSVILQH